MSRLGTQLAGTRPQPPPVQTTQTPRLSPENTDIPSWVEDVPSTFGYFYIICGTLGVGKTSLAAAFPNPIILVETTDIGAIGLRATGGIPASIPVHMIRSEVALTNMLAKLCKEQHPFKTVIFEGLSGWWQRLVLPQARQRVIDRKEDPDSWAADQKEGLAGEVTRLERAIFACLQAGLNVVCTAHTSDKTKVNRDGLNYMSQMIDIPKNAVTLLAKNASGVFCITHVPEVIDIARSDKDITTKTSKIKEHERRLYLNPTAGIEHAKNQFHCTVESVPYVSVSQVFNELKKLGMQVHE